MRRLLSADVTADATVDQTVSVGDHAPEATVLVVAGEDGLESPLDSRIGAASAAFVRRVVADRRRRRPADHVVSVDVDHGGWRRVVLVQPLQESDADAWRRAGATLAAVEEADAVVVSAVAVGLLAAMAEGWLLAGYSFRISHKPVKVGGSLVVPLSPDMVAKLCRDFAAVAFARDLGNTPSNLKSPDWLARRLQEEFEGTPVRVTVDGPDTLQRRGWGGLLAVSAGSARPPRVVVLALESDRSAPTVALVGKGVTFDSGGLSLKSIEGMATMKTDMAGAATVAGAMKALADQPDAARHTVVAVLPLADNMPSGTAYRPGDIVRQFDGSTTEIINTDAEGRLLLADALSYAVDRWRPRTLVDVATLTGAASLALSRHIGAIFSNDEVLAGEIIGAGAARGEALWQLPLVDAYADGLRSDVADVLQGLPAGTGGPGAIAAALFLRRFVGDTRWAHLDIAGPARAEKSSGVVSAGATGFGVRTLAAWLRAEGALAL